MGAAERQHRRSPGQHFRCSGNRLTENIAGRWSSPGRLAHRTVEALKHRRTLFTVYDLQHHFDSFLNIDQAGLARISVGFSFAFQKGILGFYQPTASSAAVEYRQYSSSVLTLKVLHLSRMTRGESFTKLLSIDAPLPPLHFRQCCTVSVPTVALGGGGSQFGNNCCSSPPVGITPDELLDDFKPQPAR